MKRHFFLAFGVFILAVVSSNVSSNDDEYAAEAFGKLKTLVGTWKVEGADSDFRITFETTAADTVLVETWMAGSRKHSMTLYHLDNGRLIATHYCPQGNQPRLQLTPSGESNTYRFDYFDATNLSSLENSHQHSLAFTISGAEESVARTESYLENSREAFSTLSLVKDR